MDFDPKPIIKATKRELAQLSDLKTSFTRCRDNVLRDVEAIRADADAGRMVIPEIAYHQIASDDVEAATRQQVRARGCVIVRNVFDRAQADDWNAELGTYIAQNDYFAKAKEKAGIDTYFSALDDAKPQIFGLYWSRPQVMARQAESMALTKRFLNRLYDVTAPTGQEFDPDHDFTYADRTRRRAPGDTSLGLSPHMDSGSYERWCDPAYKAIYRSIYEGDFDRYDPWKAAFRTQTREFPSPAVCSMFRTFQGWTALTTQGPGDGTLSLLPVANSIGYMLLRALQSDVAEDDLCGASPGRALGASPQWHGELLDGMISIPEVRPGDTVWWHPDILHSVASEHAGSEYANVIYIGASPVCAKNEAYARKQAHAFLAGRSAPDFAAEDYEVDFEGRATLEDLTETGRKQMSLA
jgi:hypothetical protein